MTTEHRPGDEPGARGPLDPELQDLRGRLERARGGAAGPEGDLLVADLETAYEELRTADDELRVQLEQIAEITRGAEDLRAQQERLLAALPVPTLGTDHQGLVVVANPAAAALAGAHADRLVGKPVLTLFSLEDRPALRTRISRQSLDGEVFRQRATVIDRRGAATLVEVVAAVTTVLPPAPSADAGGRPRAGTTQATWVLLPDVHQGEGTGSDRQLLPEVLLRLAALPATVDSLDDLLTRAAALCRAAAGHDVELSLRLGPLAHPEASATTDPVAEHLDSLQVLRDQGPSHDARRRAATVTVQDLRSDARWPDLGDDVPGTIGAVVACPVVAEGKTVGVLSVYRARTRTDPVLVETVELLASTLGAVLLELDLAAALRATAAEVELALTSRSEIDQARGIVMAERGCTAAEAVDHLVRLARDRGTSVRELASEVVAHHRS
jgi:PAS domain S-box-containing protein